MTATQFYELSCDALACDEAGCTEVIAAKGDPGEPLLLPDVRTFAATHGWSTRVVRVDGRPQLEDLCPRHTVEAARP